MELSVPEPLADPPHPDDASDSRSIITHTNHLDHHLHLVGPSQLHLSHEPARIRTRNSSLFHYHQHQRSNSAAKLADELSLWGGRGAPQADEYSQYGGIRSVSRRGIFEGRLTEEQQQELLRKMTPEQLHNYLVAEPSVFETLVVTRYEAELEVKNKEIHDLYLRLSEKESQITSLERKYLEAINRGGESASIPFSSKRSSPLQSERRAIQNNPLKLNLQLGNAQNEGSMSMASDVDQGVNDSHSSEFRITLPQHILNIMKNQGYINNQDQRSVTSDRSLNKSFNKTPPPEQEDISNYRRSKTIHEQSRSEGEVQHQEEFLEFIPFNPRINTLYDYDEEYSPGSSYYLHQLDLPYEYYLQEEGEDMMKYQYSKAELKFFRSIESQTIRTELVEMATETLDILEYREELENGECQTDETMKQNSFTQTRQMADASVNSYFFNSKNQNNSTMVSQDRMSSNGKINNRRVVNVSANSDDDTQLSVTPFQGNSYIENLSTSASPKIKSMKEQLEQVIPQDPELLFTYQPNQRSNQYTQTEQEQQQSSIYAEQQPIKAMQLDFASNIVNISVANHKHIPHLNLEEPSPTPETARKLPKLMLPLLCQQQQIAKEHMHITRLRNTIKLCSDSLKLLWRAGRMLNSRWKDDSVNEFLIQFRQKLNKYAHQFNQGYLKVKALGECYDQALEIKTVSCFGELVSQIRRLFEPESKSQNTTRLNTESLANTDRFMRAIQGQQY